MKKKDTVCQTKDCGRMFIKLSRWHMLCTLCQSKLARGVIARGTGAQHAHKKIHISKIAGES